MMIVMFNDICSTTQPNINLRHQKFIIVKVSYKFVNSMHVYQKFIIITVRFKFINSRYIHQKFVIVKVSFKFVNSMHVYQKFIIITVRFKLSSRYIHQKFIMVTVPGFAGEAVMSFVSLAHIKCSKVGCL